MGEPGDGREEARRLTEQRKTQRERRGRARQRVRVVWAGGKGRRVGEGDDLLVERKKDGFTLTTRNVSGWRH